MEDILDKHAEIHGYDDDIIQVNPSYFRQPAICRVNRQLREDTLKMFYSYSFDIEIHDLQFGPHAGHFVWTLNPYMLIDDRNHSWKNFKQWLHLYFNDRSIRRIKCEPRAYWSDAEAKCAPAFEMVATLADAGMTWDVIADALEAFKDATGGPTMQYGRDRWDFWDA